jgi:hypothetical protein
VDGKVEEHNKDRKEDRHRIQIGGEGKELTCTVCGYWAPRRQMAAFLQEKCMVGDEVEAIPDEFSKKERKAWRDRATQLRHARHEAGKKGGEAPGVRGTKASRSRRAPIRKRAVRRGGGHGIAVDEEGDGESRGVVNGSKACSCAIALGTNPELEDDEEQGREFRNSAGLTVTSRRDAAGKRRGTKSKAAPETSFRGEEGVEDEVGTGTSGTPVALTGEQGITRNSGSAAERTKRGARGRTKSGVASVGRTAAKRSEEEEVATGGGCRSSSNERKNEDGVSLSLSAKAETGRPPGRPKARRARCRQEVGRAGNKVGK